MYDFADSFSRRAFVYMEPLANLGSFLPLVNTGKYEYVIKGQASDEHRVKFELHPLYTGSEEHGYSPGALPSRASRTRPAEEQTSTALALSTLRCLL